MRFTQWLQGLFPKYSFPQVLRRSRKIRCSVLPASFDCTSLSHLSENLEDRTLLTTFLVDDSFAGVDEAAHQYTTIQAAIDVAEAGDSIVINTGRYYENVRIYKSLNISGATGSAADVVIESNSGTTVTLQNSGATFSDLTVNAADGMAFNVLGGAGVDANIVLNNVVANAAREALFLNANNGATYNVELNDVRFDGAGTDALEVLARNGASVTLVATNLSATDAAGSAVRITARDGADVNARFTNSNLDRAGTNALFVVSDNAVVDTFTSHTSMNDAGAYGFIAKVDHGAEGSARFEYSPSNNAGRNALRVDALNNAHYAVDVIDGSMLGSGSDALFINQDTGSVVDLFVDPTPKDRGFKFTGNNGTHLNAAVDNQVLSSTTEPANFGIFGELFGGADMTLTVRGGTNDGALLDGIFVTAVGTLADRSVFNLILDKSPTDNPSFPNSAVTNAGRRGLALDVTLTDVNIEFKNGAVITGSAANNVFINAKDNSVVALNFDATSGNLSGSTGSDGLFALLDNSDLTIDFAGAANLSNNNRHGMSLNANNGSSVVINATHGLNLDGSGGSGIIANADASSIVVRGATVNGTTSIANVGQDGILVIGKNNGSVALDLKRTTSIANAGDNAIHFNLASGSIGDVRISPPSGGTLNMDDAGNDAVFANATGNSTMILQLSNFSMNHAGGSGVNINLDTGAHLSNSTLVNGSIVENGDLLSTTHGLQISALGGSTVGDRASKSNGLTLTNVNIGNALLNPAVQDIGVKAIVDGNSYVGVRLNGGAIDHNGGDGVNAEVNPDASAMDSSLLILSLVGTNVVNNQGDGFHLRATNGTGTLATQLSGIIVNFDGGDITNNGNANPGDGIGDGIDAAAIGDSSVAGNTVITLNNVNFDLSGNDEDSFRILQTGGGVVRRNLTGGVIDSLVLCANGPLDVQAISLNGTIVNSGLFMCAENGGTVEANISNIDFVGTTGPGVTFRAKTGGKINSSLTNVNIRNAGPSIDVNTNLGGTGAVIGLVEDAMSDVHFDLTNVTITDSLGAVMSGFDLRVINGGTYHSTIRNLTTERNKPDNGKAEFNVVIDGPGSNATFDIDQLNANNSTKRGIQFIGTNGATLSIPRFDRVFANNAIGFGLNIDLTNSFLPVFHSDVARFNNSGSVGANFKIANSSTPVDLLLANFWAEDANGTGIDVLLDNVHGGTSNVHANNVRAQRSKTGNGLRVRDTTMNATDKLNITVDGNTRLGFSALNALDIQAGGAAGSEVSISVDGLNATGAKRTGVNIGLQGSIVGDIVALNNITMLGTKNFGVSVLANGAAALRTLNSNSVNANGSAWAGMKIQLDAQAIPTNINISNYTADDAGRRGFDITLDGSFGGASTINLDNASALRTQLNNGALIKASNMGAADVLNVNLTNSNFSQDIGNSLIADNTPTASPRRRGKNAIAFQFDGAAGSQVNLRTNNVLADHSGATGISAFFGGGVRASVPEFNNISATNAFGAGAIFSVGTAATLTDINSSSLNVANAINGAGLYAFVDSQAVGTTLIFDTLTTTNAGRIGVDITLVDVHGDSVVTLSNVAGTGAKAGEGLNFDDRGMAPGDTIALNIQAADFSSSFLDAVNLNFDGVGGSTATGTVAVDGLTAQQAGNDGLDININNGVQIDVTQFDNVNAQSNDENGLKVLVTNGAGLVDFVASNLNLSNNATSGVGFDGIDVQVHDANSTAVFNLSNLTVNNSGGRGIDLDVFGNGSLTFNVNGGSVNNSGLGGLDLNVASNDEFGLPVAFSGPATFNASFKDLDVSSNGQSLVFARDGINLDVQGAGAVANVAFDHVTANNNDDDGFDIFANGGAVTNIQLDNASSGNNNGGPSGGVTGRGFRFRADGAATVVSLSSAAGALGNNLFNNNVNGPGFEVTLTNAVTANDMTINASASGNNGDGVRVIANDGSGVTINQFGVAGSGLQVNSNLGNGLFVDFFDVRNINSFDLSNATVSGNTGDQVFVRLRGKVDASTNRPMQLTDFLLRNVTLTGTATSGDGIEIQLIDTFVNNVSTPGVAKGFVVENVHSSGNGAYGFNLSVEEADLPGFFGGGDGVVSSGIAGGLIIGSEFNNNRLAGFRAQFGGDGTTSFDIFNNTAGFHNNTGEGLLVQIQDRAQFKLEGGTPFDADPLTRSFFNNSVAGNTGVGVRFVASEPNDPDLINADAFGPRYDLALGDILRNPNTITGNRDAAISVEGGADSTGSFTIVNSILSNTTNGALSGLNGDGLNVHITDFAELETFTVDGTAAGLDVSGNAGSGIVTQVSRSGRLGTVSRMLVLNTTIDGNGLHGIDVQRRDNGFYGDIPANHAIVIGQTGAGNSLRNNTGNGINIQNENKPGQPITFDLDMTDNTLTNNLNGIFLHGTGNAQFSGNASDNDFTSNRLDGFQVVLENDASLGNSVAATNYTVGDGPAGVVMADFNGDGHLDIATANSNSGNVSILINNGRGNYLQPSSLPTPLPNVYAAGSVPVAITSGDFNGDGNADLAVVNRNSNNVSILLGNGDGSFGAATNVAVGTAPTALVVADFNGDLISDLAVTNSTDNNVSILQGVGNGTFTSLGTVAVGTNPSSITAAKMDANNFVDLVVTNRGSNNVSVVRGLGDGTFLAALNFATGTAPVSVATGDFDANGTVDVVVANNTSSTVSLLRGVGDGTLLAALNTATVGTPTALAVGHFNDDTFLDVVVTGSTGARVMNGGSNAGTPTLTTARTYTVGTTPAAIAVGAVDGDDLDDLVVGNFGSDNVSVLRSNPAFWMDGNQFLSSGRHGIFFDTNFTNENGLFGGGAFVNVDIRSSDKEVDAFGAQVRTVINGNGTTGAGNGIQIIDNSDYTSTLAFSPVLQNTYRVRGTSVTSNRQDGIFVMQGNQTLPGGPSGGPTRDNNNGLALIVGDANTAYLGNRDVVLQGNQDDGVDLQIRDGDASFNVFTIDRSSILLNGANGDNQRNEMGPQNVGHGVEVELSAAGRLNSTYTNVDVLQNSGDGVDYNVTTVRNGTIGTTTMLATQVSQNGGRGLDVNLEHDRGTDAGASISNWFIGTAANVNNASMTNRFNENAREGIVVNIEATGMDQDTVADPSEDDEQFDQPNRNNDVFVEGNLPRQAGSFAPRDFISTGFTGLGLLGVGNTTIGTGDFMAMAPGDIQTFSGFAGTQVHLIGNVDIINTEVANNGGFAGFEDGLDFGIGYLTRINSYIANASFGGNVGDDIRIYSQQSNEVLPPISNFDPRNNRGAPGDGFLVYDPVAYLDLVFGMVDSDGNGVPDTVAGNGRAANSGTGGVGNGDQIAIYSVGTTQTSQITNTGVITTADPMKRNTRPVYLAGRVYDAGTFNNTAVNDFFQNGVQQNIAGQFGFFETFAGVGVPIATNY